MRFLAESRTIPNQTNDADTATMASDFVHCDPGKSISFRATKAIEIAITTAQIESEGPSFTEIHLANKRGDVLLRIQFQPSASESLLGVFFNSKLAGGPWGKDEAVDPEKLEGKFPRTFALQHITVTELNDRFSIKLGEQYRTDFKKRVKEDSTISALSYLSSASGPIGLRIMKGVH